eukprot:TRINITY_DN16650_c0_g1_i1.p2 TRINITY_DN16650_c0_g1~~TRINITY_DN16650_c0_g1_i1.p2  ORF type:complete len:277 (-),score=33.38 TRINITY_DN16650_c0_g1_i1:289-1005(-)
MADLQGTLATKVASVLRDRQRWLQQLHHRQDREAKALAAQTAHRDRHVITTLTTELAEKHQAESLDDRRQWRRDVAGLAGTQRAEFAALVAANNTGGEGPEGTTRRRPSTASLAPPPDAAPPPPRRSPDPPPRWNGSSGLWSMYRYSHGPPVDGSTRTRRTHRPLWREAAVPTEALPMGSRIRAWGRSVVGPLPHGPWDLAGMRLMAGGRYQSYPTAAAISVEMKLRARRRPRLGIRL